MSRELHGSGIVDLVVPDEECLPGAVMDALRGRISPGVVEIELHGPSVREAALLDVRIGREPRTKDWEQRNRKRHRR